MNMRIDFVKERTYKSLMIMALPLFAILLLNSLCSIVDVLWLQKLMGNNVGTSPVLAVSVTSTITSTLYLLVFGIANGVSIIVSQSVGRKDDKETIKVISTTFIMSMGCIAVLLALSEILLPSLLKNMGMPNGLYRSVYKYASIYLLSSIPICIYLYFSAALKSFGNTIIQLIAMIMCTCINIILDPVLITSVGYTGAASATVISQVIAFIFLLIYIICKKTIILNFKAFDKTIAIECLKKCTLTAFQQCMPIIVTIILNLIYSSISTPSMEINSLISRLEGILLYPAIAFNVALINIVGQCTGAKRMDRVRDYIKASLKTAIPMLAVMSVFVMIFSGRISTLYTKTAGNVKLVKIYFLIVGIGYILNVVTNCYLGAVNGLGKPGQALILTIFNYIVARAILAVIIVLFGGAMIGMWRGILVSYVAACIVTVTAGNKIIKKKYNE